MNNEAIPFGVNTVSYILNELYFSGVISVPIIIKKKQEKQTLMSTLATAHNEFRGVECNDTDIANYDVTKSYLLGTIINCNYV